MHDIFYVKRGKHSVTVKIDGKEVTLTRRRNSEAVFSAETISTDLDEIIYRCKNDIPLNIKDDFNLSGINVFRLINAFCRDEIFTYWRHICLKVLMSQEFDAVQYRTALHLAFGYIPAGEANQIDFFKMLLPIWHEVKTSIPAKKFDKHILIANNDQYRVERYYIENNLITYLINDVKITFCLSRSAHLINARIVLDLIDELDKALTTKNCTDMLCLIKKNGSLNIRKLIGAFFMNEAKDFFLQLAQKELFIYRRKIFPNKIVKEYFGANWDHVYTEIIETLEDLLPYANEYLVKTSVLEVETDKSIWSLYDKTPNGISQSSVPFYWKEPLNSEIRNYLRACIRPYVLAEKSFGSIIQTHFETLAHSLDVLYGELNFQIESILELTSAQCLALATYFSQQGNYDTKAQIGYLVKLRAFYHFTAKQKCHKLPSPFEAIKIPKLRNRSYIKPITDEVINFIKMSLKDLPFHISLAFLVALDTGGRNASVCELKTTDLQKQDGKYVLVIRGYKTEIKKMKSKQPIISRHELPDWLGELLEKYIAATENLRVQCDAPYIFVYCNPNLREGTKRAPSVLNSKTFIDQIDKLLEKGPPMYHEDGTLATCTFASIRAKVGRTLFGKGWTAAQVAAFLGNTEFVATTHYNYKTAAEEAEHYEEHYKKTFVPVFEHIRYKKNKPVTEHNDRVMYGTCTIETKCIGHTDCMNCPNRAICAEQ